MVILTHYNSATSKCQEVGIVRILKLYPLLLSLDKRIKEVLAYSDQDYTLIPPVANPLRNIIKLPNSHIEEVIEQPSPVIDFTCWSNCVKHIEIVTNRLD